MTLRDIYLKETPDVLTSNSFGGRMGVAMKDSCWEVMPREEGQAKTRGQGRLFTGRNSWARPYRVH